MGIIRRRYPRAEGPKSYKERKREWNQKKMWVGKKGSQAKHAERRAKERKGK